MDRRVEDVIRKFTGDVKKILGSTLRRVILYGSYARGDEHEGSDVDLMILTSLSDKQIETIENKIYDLAFDYEMDYGLDISTVINNSDTFDYWLGALPFYDNVKKEGIEINV